MSGKNKLGTWFGFLLILLWCLFPVAWIISLSFKSVSESTSRLPLNSNRAMA
jgi:multiple sugar transport system permease protein